MESKLARTRAAMKEAGATAHVLTTLDDICWTLNIRGNDVEYFPLVLTYAVIRMDKVDLFVNEKKLSDEIKAHLAADGVILHPYNDIYEDIKKVAAEEVLMQKTHAPLPWISDTRFCLQNLLQTNLPKAVLRN